MQCSRRVRIRLLCCSKKHTCAVLSQSTCREPPFVNKEPLAHQACSSRPEVYACCAPHTSCSHSHILAVDAHAILALLLHDVRSELLTSYIPDLAMYWFLCLPKPLASTPRPQYREKEVLGKELVVRSEFWCMGLKEPCLQALAQTCTSPTQHVSTTRAPGGYQSLSFCL
eukprot:scaffold155273_cov20-Tisochrysis_lutea.AAC.2